MISHRRHPYCLLMRAWLARYSRPPAGGLSSLCGRLAGFFSDSFFFEDRKREAAKPAGQCSTCNRQRGTATIVSVEGQPQECQAGRGGWFLSGCCGQSDSGMLLGPCTGIVRNWRVSPPPENQDALSVGKLLRLPGDQPSLAAP